MTRLLVFRIGNILRKCEHDHNRVSGFWIREYYNIPDMVRRIFVLPMMFLVFYYFTHCLYQFALHVVCSVNHHHQLRSLTVASGRTSTTGLIFGGRRGNPISLCSLSYVSNIRSRLSQQVSSGHLVFGHHKYNVKSTQI